MDGWLFKLFFGHLDACMLGCLDAWILGHLFVQMDRWIPPSVLQDIVPFGSAAQNGKKEGKMERKKEERKKKNKAK